MANASLARLIFNYWSLQRTWLQRFAGRRQGGFFSPGDK
jgi:hypothetical protein